MTRSRGPVAPGTTFIRRSPAIILPDRGLHRAMMEQSCQQQQGHFGFGFVGGKLPTSGVEAFFNTTAYTGTGIAARGLVTGMDLVSNAGMVMFATNQTSFPGLIDASRGAGSLTSLGSPAADAASGVSFTSDGLTLGSGFPNSSGIAGAATTWLQHPKLFKAIGYSGSSAARVIPHGLGVSPGFVVIKSRSNNTDGTIWHKGLTSGFFGFSTQASELSAQNQTVFGNPGGFIAPDATNVYIGADGVFGTVNTSGAYIMYVFADDPTGWIAHGSYFGNGSSSGPVLNLGWEPQWLLIKSRTANGDWMMADNVRGFSNPKPWSNSAFGTGVGITSSTTGFQLTDSNIATNASGVGYYYTAVRKP